MIKYTKKERATPMSESDLADEYRKGLEFINVVRDQAGIFHHYFVYRGGLKSGNNR